MTDGLRMMTIQDMNSGGSGPNKPVHPYGNQSIPPMFLSKPGPKDVSQERIMKDMNDLWNQLSSANREKWMNMVRRK